MNGQVRAWFRVLRASLMQSRPPATAIVVRMCDYPPHPPETFQIESGVDLVDFVHGRLAPRPVSLHGPGPEGVRFASDLRRPAGLAE